MQEAVTIYGEISLFTLVYSCIMESSYFMFTSIVFIVYHIFHLLSRPLLSPLYIAVHKTSKLAVIQAMLLFGKYEYVSSIPTIQYFINRH